MLANSLQKYYSRWIFRQYGHRIYDWKNKRIFEQYNIIVAELKNEVIGFCRYDYNNYYEEENVDCELIALYIKPEMKRHGIGRKLMKYAINEFKNSKKKNDFMVS